MLGRLASFSRLILFDKRGSGLSDRVPQVPTLEQRMDDVRAVLDAAGSERAAIIGVSEGGPMSVLFAATYPERTAALVLYGSFAEFSSLVATPQELEFMLQFMDVSWGTGLSLIRFAPSMVDNEQFRSWWGRFERLSASPGAAMALIRMNSEIDVPPVLPAVHVPTLVLHRRDDVNVPVAAGRHMAQQIPGAKYVELAGRDHLPWVGDADAIITEIQEFLTGARHVPEPDRVLATVLFVDMVGSTERATAAGVTSWRVTIVWCGRNSVGSTVGKSARLAMVSWRRLMGRREPSVVRVPSGMRCGSSGSRFDQGCTPASARSWRVGRMWAGSPFTSAPGSRPPPPPARCWSQAR